MKLPAAEVFSWIGDRTLREQRDWSSLTSSHIERIEMEIAEKISCGIVHVWGRRSRHALPEVVPESQFTIRDLKVVVDCLGGLGIRPSWKTYRYEGIEWVDIEFDEEEVKRCWPVERSEVAEKWMMREAESNNRNGIIAKRADMVHRCCVETGCKKREAEAAHKSLPDHLKRARGRPRAR